MRTLTFYFNVEAAAEASRRYRGHVNWKRYIRVRSSNKDELEALNTSLCKPGETLLNTVTVEAEPHD